MINITRVHEKHLEVVLFQELHVGEIFRYYAAQDHKNVYIKVAGLDANFQAVMLRDGKRYPIGEDARVVPQKARLEVCDKWHAQF